MDLRSFSQQISREQMQWDRSLLLVRESAQTWAIALMGLTSETGSIFDRLETEMTDTLKNYWGPKASIIFDRVRKTAHATDDQGLCMDLMTGEIIEWTDTAS